MGVLKERHVVNPFMESLAKYVQPKKIAVKHATGSAYTNEETGEQFNSVIIEKSEKFEDFGDFIKLKTTNYAIDHLINLSPASYKLLFWMMRNLQYHLDYVTIYGPRAMEDLRYKSINSIYKAIDGLIQARIIAPKEGGTWLFYINPVILYKGNMLFLFFQYKATMEKEKREKEMEPADVTDIPVTDNPSIMAKKSDLTPFRNEMKPIIKEVEDF